MSATPEALSLKSPRELYFDWERAQSEGAWDALGVEDGALGVRPRSAHAAAGSDRRFAAELTHACSAEALVA